MSQKPVNLVFRVRSRPCSPSESAWIADFSRTAGLGNSTGTPRGAPGFQDVRRPCRPVGSRLLARSNDCLLSQAPPTANGPGRRRSHHDLRVMRRLPNETSSLVDAYFLHSSTAVSSPRCSPLFTVVYRWLGTSLVHRRRRVQERVMRSRDPQHPDTQPVQFTGGVLHLRSARRAQPMLQRPTRAGIAHSLDGRLGLPSCEAGMESGAVSAVDSGPRPSRTTPGGWRGRRQRRRSPPVARSGPWRRRGKNAPLRGRRRGSCRCPPPLPG